MLGEWKIKKCWEIMVDEIEKYKIEECREIIDCLSLTKGHTYRVPNKNCYHSKMIRYPICRGEWDKIDKMRNI